MPNSVEGVQHRGLLWNINTITYTFRFHAKGDSQKLNIEEMRNFEILIANVRTNPQWKSSEFGQILTF